jgi:hypothetical protein
MAASPYRERLPRARISRRELSAILPEAPVEATARTLRWPLRSARRLPPLASLTLRVLDVPGARSYRLPPSSTTALTPASRIGLAVRSASDPVQLADALAGQLTLIGRSRFSP